MRDFTNQKTLGIQKISKGMIKNKWGRIVNITSISGHMGAVGQSNYSASKAGIVGLSKSVAKELASRNINVNIISPGYIETPMTSNLNEQQQNKIMDRVPMKKFGQPQDIANIVNFLVSDNSNYITGQNFHVNGGMLMV